MGAPETTRPCTGARPVRLSATMVVAAGLACNSGPASVPMEPVPAPSVEITVAFGDPPLTGHVVLDGSVGAGWSFEVDLDGDGSADRVGVVEQIVSIEYVFVEPGPHVFGIVLRRGDERVASEHTVVVTDPDRLEFVDSVDLGDEILEGTVVDRPGTNLFVSTGIRAEIVVLDPASLEVVDVVEQGGRTLEGLAYPPDADRLLVIDKDTNLRILDPEGLTELHRFDVNGAFFVHAAGDALAYTSGSNVGIDRVDLDASETLATYRTEGFAGHFAVSRDGERVVVIDSDPVDLAGVHALVVVDAERMIRLRRFELDVLPVSIGLSPDADRAVVFYQTIEGPEACGFLAIDLADGAVVHDIPTGPQCHFPLATGVANPVASTSDGRWLVFATPSGLVLVDAAEGVPVARTPASVGEVSLCCDVSVSPIEDVAFVAGGVSGVVSKVRIRR